MLLIIIHHIQLNLYSVYGIHFPYILNILFQSLGYLATGVFFLISGYGLYSSLSKNSPITTSYAFKHIKGILVPFLLVWFVDSIGVLFFGGRQIEVFSNLITLSFSYGGGSLWFLKSITIIYLIVFLLWWVVTNNRNRIIFISVTIVAWVIVSITAQLDSYWYNSVLCFPLGMLCAHSRVVKNRIDSFPFVILLFIFVSSYFLFIAVQSYNRLPLVQTIIYSIAIIVSSLSFSLMAVKVITIINFQSKILNYVGVNSIVFYLSHIWLASVGCLFINPFVYCLFVSLGTVAFVILIKAFRSMTKL